MKSPAERLLACKCPVLIGASKLAVPDHIHRREWLRAYVLRHGHTLDTNRSSTLDHSRMALYRKNPGIATRSDFAVWPNATDIAAQAIVSFQGNSGSARRGTRNVEDVPKASSLPR